MRGVEYEPRRGRRGQAAQVGACQGTQAQVQGLFRLKKLILRYKKIQICPKKILKKMPAFFIVIN